MAEVESKQPSKLEKILGDENKSSFDPQGWYTGKNDFNDYADPVQDADDL